MSESVFNISSHNKTLHILYTSKTTSEHPYNLTTFSGRIFTAFRNAPNFVFLNPTLTTAHRNHKNVSTASKMASNQILHHHLPFTLTHVHLIYYIPSHTNRSSRLRWPLQLYQICHTRLPPERHTKFFPTPIFKSAFSANQIFTPTKISNLKIGGTMHGDRGGDQERGKNGVRPILGFGSFSKERSEARSRPNFLVQRLRVVLSPSLLPALFSFL